MGVLGALMRVYSYLFHGLLSLVMVLIALVSWLSGAHALNLLLLPWQGGVLRWLLLVCGLAGLVIVWLATRQMLRVVFLVWSAVVFLALLRGFFFGWVHYLRGPYPLSWALALTLAALAALAGGWLQYRKPKTAEC